MFNKFLVLIIFLFFSNVASASPIDPFTWNFNATVSVPTVTPGYDISDVITIGDNFSLDLSFNTITENNSNVLKLAGTSNINIGSTFSASGLSDVTIVDLQNAVVLNSSPAIVTTSVEAITFGASSWTNLPSSILGLTTTFFPPSGALGTDIFNSPTDFFDLEEIPNGFSDVSLLVAINGLAPNSVFGSGLAILGLENLTVGRVNNVSVLEPSTFLLMSAGFIGLLSFRKRPLKVDTST